MWASRTTARPRWASPAVADHVFLEAAASSSRSSTGRRRSRVTKPARRREQMREIQSPVRPAELAALVTDAAKHISGQAGSRRLQLSVLRPRPIATYQREGGWDVRDHQGLLFLRRGEGLRLVDRTAIAARRCSRSLFHQAFSAGPASMRPDRWIGRPVSSSMVGRGFHYQQRSLDLESRTQALPAAELAVKQRGSEAREQTQPNSTVLAKPRDPPRPSTSTS